MEKYLDNEAPNLPLRKTAVISRLSQLPRRGLLADFSQIGLEQLVEFSANDFYDPMIFEMQLEHIEGRARDLNAQFVVIHMSGNDISMSDYYIFKFTH